MRCGWAALTGRGLTGRRLTVLLAVACAVTSSNLYIVQPLLGEIAADLRISQSAASWVATAAQVGYAVGILLLVPLGDIRERRRLVLLLCGGVCLALAAAVMAPNLMWLTVASFAVGLCTPIPQVLIPMGVALSGGARRGALVGTLQAGLLVGLLASRSYAGLLGQLYSWRSVYVISALAMIALTLVLQLLLPASRGSARTGYSQLLASLASMVVRDRRLLGLCMSGALVGVAFGAFWNTLAFELQDEHGAGPATVGLFGLVAAASALTSPLAGRLADRIGGRWTQAIALLIAVAGWAVLAAGHASISWLILGTVLLDVGIWSNQVTNQSVLFQRDAAQHSRLNTLYFSTRFAGIASGALVGTAIWSRAGWASLGWAATAALVVALPLAIVTSRTSHQATVSAETVGTNR